MSGKSTYIRTVALLQVMAQIGCFVPAQFASFTIIHNLFSRVSIDDSIEANMSTFSVEMRDMAFILRLAIRFEAVTRHSHVIETSMTKAWLLSTSLAEVQAHETALQ